MRIYEATNLVTEELLKATENYGSMSGLHEGYAVILEELDELWTEIKKWPHEDKEKIKKEATQVAAMATRFLVDNC